MTAATVTSQTDGTTVAIAVAGEVDLLNAADVEDEILASIDNQATMVTVDLTNLSYLDSSGLRILFVLSSRLQVLQIDMEVVAPRGSRARRVVELSGFGKLVTLKP
jgi:anti-anti-sigma factor